MAIPRNLANIAPHVNASSTELVVNDGGANLDFRVEGDTDANLLFVDAGTDRVGIGTNAPASKLQAGAKTSSTSSDVSTIFSSGGASTSGGQIYAATFCNTVAPANNNEVLISFTPGSNYSATGAIGNMIENVTTAASCLKFYSYNQVLGNAERARITSGGDLLVGTTENNSATAGVAIGGAGFGVFARNSDTCINANRITNDGTIVSLRQDNVEEGTISVSGNTVSYNAFTGGHWSQLQEGRGYNPDIPRGTVMSTIGEMCEWKSVEWTETIEHAATEEKEAWTKTIPHRESYLGDLPVGATFEEDGFTKTIVDDGNERLPKVKISDVVGDKAVYGVFQTWDDVQDMLITSLGAFVVRIAAGVTVEIGDLLESNGDGCAKVQDDDIIRSKTIAKVTSTTPTETYADGSYTVPAVIYCG